MGLFRRKRARPKSRAIVEVLEPRVLYSADAWGPLASLLPDDQTEQSSELLLPAIPAEDPPQVSENIAFVVEDIPDADSIQSSLDRAGIEIRWIGADDNGIQIITDTLADRSDITTVHIVSHGDTSVLQLGSSILDTNAIEAVEHELQVWGQALHQDADILIYGCNFAGDDGDAVRKIATLTGADVAASEDITGHESKGGDWILEVSEGVIESTTFDDEILHFQWRDILMPEIIVVSTLDDSVAPDMGADVTTLGPNPTLREAVIAAQNTGGDVIIELSTPGTYLLELAGPDDSSEVGDLDINLLSADDTLTITNTSGAEVFLESDADNRLFDVFQGTLVVEGVNFVGINQFFNGIGVYVNNGGNLEFNSGIIENFTSPIAAGSAIYNEGNVTINDSIIRNNIAFTGAGIYGTADSQITLNETTLDNNEALLSTGGAIYTVGGLDVTGGSFIGNSAFTSGGAISGGADVTLVDTHFENNSATRNAGAIFQSTGSLDVSGTDFINNRATSFNGGAIASTNDTVLTIDQSSFSDNTALGHPGDEPVTPPGDGGGGAILINSPDAEISNTSFLINQAFVGGAVQLGPGGDGALFDGVTFTQNLTVQAHQTEDDRGGAVLSQAQNVRFENSLFNENESSNGGAIYNFTGSNNTVIRNTTFSENVAFDDGGAIFSLTSLYIEFSTFYKNNSFDSGGAIGLFDNLEVGNSVFFENTDVASGGFNDIDFGAGSGIQSNGYNFFTQTDLTPTDLLFSDTHNVSVTDRLSFGLDDLTPNTNGVATHHLRPGSVLINAGSTSETGSTDARGVTRDALPDVGAHESETTQAQVYITDDLDRVIRGTYESGLMQIIVDGRPNDNSLEPRDIVVDSSAEKIYWIEVETSGLNSTILQSNLDGSNIQVFANLVGEVARSLAHDGTNRLLVAYAGSNKTVDVFNTTAPIGTAPSQFGTVTTNLVRDIEIDPNTGRVFWTQGPDLNTHELATANSDGSPDKVESFAYSLDGLAVNPNTQTIATLNSDTDELQFYDYNLDLVGTPATAVGESLDFNVGTDSFLTASIAGQEFSVYDDSANQLQVSAIDSGQPEAISSYFPTNLPLTAQSVGTLSVAESGVVDVTTLELLVVDPDGSDSPGDIFYTIQSIPANPVNPANQISGIYRLDTGSSTYINLAIGDVFSQLDVDQGLIQYRQDGQESNSTTSNDQIELLAEGSDTGFSLHITLPVDITDENDVPTVFNSPDWNVGENASLTLDNTLLSVHDADIAHGPAEIEYTLLSLPTNSNTETNNNNDAGLYLNVSGSGLIVRLDVNDTFTQQDINNGYLEYRQNGQEKNTNQSDDQISFTARDPAGATTNQFSIDIIVGPETNDIPEFVLALDWQVTENGVLTVDNTLLAAHDDDIADSDADIIFTLIALPPDPNNNTDVANLAGLYLEDQVTAVVTRLAINDTFTQQDIDDGRIEYRQNGQESNTLAADNQVHLEITDTHGTGSNSVAINTIVTPQNDIPEITVALDWQVAENGALTINNTLLAAEDSDIADSDADIIFTLIALPPDPNNNTDAANLAGLYREDQVTGVVTRLAINDTFTQRDIDDGRIEYRQNGQESNALATDNQVLLEITDSHATGSNSIVIDTIVVAQNDIPEITLALDWHVAENGTLTIDNTLLAAEDSDIADSDADIIFTLIALPPDPNNSTDVTNLAGLYREDQVTGVVTRLAINDTFTQQDIDDGRIEYRQNGQESNTLAADNQVQLEVTDSHATGSNSVAINTIVVAQNDIPEFTVALDWQVAENGALTIANTLLAAQDSDTADSDANIIFTLIKLPPDPNNSTDVANLAGLYLEDQVTGVVSRLAINDMFTQQDIDDGRIEYRQNGQESNTLATDNQVLLEITDSHATGSNSVAIDTIVVAQNDIPEITLALDWQVAENDVLTIDNTLLAAQDSDIADNDADIIFTLIALPPDPNNNTDVAILAGLYLEDQVTGVVSRLVINDTFTQQDIDDGRIEYRQNGQESNTLATDNQVLLEITDTHATGSNSVAINTIVVAQNDVPEFTLAKDWQVAENGALTVDNTLLAAHDDDIADNDADIIFTLIALPPDPNNSTDVANLAGLYLEDQVTGVVSRLAINDTFTQQDIDDGRIEYRQNGQETNTLATDNQVHLEITDSHATGSNSIAINTIVVTQNDIPEITLALDWQVAENGALTIDNTLLAAHDDDIADNNADIIYTLIALPPDPNNSTDVAKLAGLYLEDQVTGVVTRLTINDTFTQQDIDDGRIEYRQNGQESNILATDNQVLLEITDSNGTGSNSVTIDVIINSENNAPELVNAATIDVDENGTSLLNPSLLLVSDDDLVDSPEQVIFTIDSIPSNLISTEPVENSAGLYLRDIISGIFTRMDVGDSFSQQDINSGNVEYRQNGQEKNPVTANDRIGLMVRDSVGNTIGPISIDVNVISAPDIPIVQHAGPWNVAENGELTISQDPLLPPGSGPLLSTDNDLNDSSEQLQYAIESNPISAISHLSGTEPAGLYRLDVSGPTNSYIALAVGDTFTQKDVDDGLIIYRQNGQEPNNLTTPDSMTLTVMDSSGNTSASIIMIDIFVTPENDAPILSSNPVAIDEAGQLILDHTAIVIFDPDGDPIESMSIEIINPIDGQVTVNGDPNRIASGAEFLSGRIVYTHDGLSSNDVSLLVQITDPAGATTGINVPVTINPINDLPIITTSPLQVAESDTVNLTVSNLSPTDEETNDALLEYVIDASSLNYGTILDDTGAVRSQFTQQDIIDQRIVYAHDGSEPNSEILLFEIHDGQGGVVASELEILISPTNDAPVLVGTVENQVATEDQLFELVFDSALWTDTDTGDNLNLQITQIDGTPLPSWLSFDGAYTLSGTPTNADIGSISISVTATDMSGAAANVLQFEIDVINVNTAPFNLTLDGSTVDENAPGMVVGSVNASDLDVGDVLTYTVSDQRFDIVAGELILKADEQLNHEFEETIALSINVTDTAGAVASLDVDITVNDVNDTPVLATAPVLPILQTDDIVQIPLDTFTDEDQFDTVSYSVTQADGSELPAWLIFTDDQELIVTPDPRDETLLNIILIATDSNGARAELDLTLEFEPQIAPAEPTIEAIEPTVAEMVVLPTEPELEITEEVTVEEVAEEAAPDQTPPESNEQKPEIEEVDLQSLITPLPTVSNFEITQEQDSTPNVIRPDSKFRTANISINLLDLSTLIEQSPEVLSQEFTNLTKAFDNQREDFAEQVSFRQKAIGSTVTLTSGFSVGYVIWLIRGGTLMGSMLSALPAWRFVDPLPILGALDDVGDGDDDSLESLVDSDTSSETDDSSDDPETHNRAA